MDTLIQNNFSLKIDPPYCLGPVPPDKVVEDLTTGGGDTRIKKWLVCQTGVLAVRVIHAVGTFLVRVVRSYLK
jgi:hypothetical protein